MPPRYPDLRYQNETKKNIRELEAAYSKLTALGLYLMPKLAKDKVPLARYWRKIDPDTYTGEPVQQRNSVHGWCVATGSRSNRVVVVDIDTAEVIRNGRSAYEVYDFIQSLAPSAFVIETPACGVHIYYHVPEQLDLLGNVRTPYEGVDFRGEGGQVVTIGGVNTYVDEMAVKKGVQSGHTAAYKWLPDGDYSSIPEMSDALYDWLNSNHETAKQHATKGENYAQTPQGMERLRRHFGQPLQERERLTLECLSYVLRDYYNYGREYWLQVWMSAHHASSGSAIVRDYILSHPAIGWSDGEAGKTKFVKDWATHEYREGGFTASSLLYLARQNGWLKRTGYEIPEEITTKISVERVSDWIAALPEIPNRLLLQSQTGSGKTFAIRAIWERLGRPKSVIFVPSIKLAIELGTTLKTVHGLPVTIYRDTDTLTPLEREELRNAQVLVITLQSFATRVENEMMQYGLVYVEESDQLLAQFARGGGGMYSSHVSEKEARAGFRVLKDAMNHSQTVWMVDATMSRVSYETMVRLSITPPNVILNTYIAKKSDVYMAESRESVYQAIAEALLANQKVVVAADTVAAAHEIKDLMTQTFPKRKILCITRTTARTREVALFMQDVNEGAKQYDLVVYNSVMASGVSITSVKPDLVVQIANYLTPRNNLQLLNRYREQGQVVVWYQERESLYDGSSEMIYSDATIRATLEAQLIHLPMAERSDLAELRARLATLSVADEAAQQRSPVAFYKALLEGDGRVVVDAQGDPAAETLRHTLMGIRKAKAEQQEIIAGAWPTIPPIDDARPALPEYSDLEVAFGEAHAHVEKSLRGNIPTDTEPEKVYEIVNEFSNTGFVLAAFVMQDEALRRAEQYIIDGGKAITSFVNHITLFTVVSLTKLIFHALDETLSEETYAIRGKEFMLALTPMKEAYNAVVSKAQAFDAIYEKNTTDPERAKAFAKILLAKVGLKQRAERAGIVQGVQTYEYRIVNLEHARLFLSWRNKNEDNSDLSLTIAPVESKILERQPAVERFMSLSASEQAKVMAIMTKEPHTSFEMAVMTITNGEW